MYTQASSFSKTVSVKRGGKPQVWRASCHHSAQRHHPSRSEQWAEGAGRSRSHTTHICLPPVSCAAISNQLLSVRYTCNFKVGRILYPAHAPAPRPTYQCMGRRRVPSAALRAHAPHASLSAAGVAAAATHERHTPGPYARRGQHKPHQPAPAAPAPAPAAAAAAASAAARDAAARASRPSVEQISSTRALVSSKQ